MKLNGVAILTFEYKSIFYFRYYKNTKLKKWIKFKLIYYYYLRDLIC